MVKKVGDLVNPKKNKKKNKPSVIKDKKPLVIFKKNLMKMKMLM